MKTTYIERRMMTSTTVEFWQVEVGEVFSKWGAMYEKTEVIFNDLGPGFRLLNAIRCDNGSRFCFASDSLCGVNR